MKKDEKFVKYSLTSSYMEIFLNDSGLELLRWRLCRQLFCYEKGVATICITELTQHERCSVLSFRPSSSHNMVHRLIRWLLMVDCGCGD